MTPEHKAAIAAGRKRALAHRAATGGEKPSKAKSPSPRFTMSDTGELTIDGGRWECPLDAAATAALYAFLARWRAHDKAPAVTLPAFGNLRIAEREEVAA